MSTSRVVGKGRRTMEALMLSLKHSWRFVDAEALALQALAWEVDGQAT